MLHYSQGIVDTVAKDSLVDIFPWLQVDHMNTLNVEGEKHTGECTSQNSH